MTEELPPYIILILMIMSSPSLKLECACHRKSKNLRKGVRGLVVRKVAPLRSSPLPLLLPHFYHSTVSTYIIFFYECHFYCFHYCYCHTYTIPPLLSSLLRNSPPAINSLDLPVPLFHQGKRATPQKKVKGENNLFLNLK